MNAICIFFSFNDIDIDTEEVGQGRMGNGRRNAPPDWIPGCTPVCACCFALISISVHSVCQVPMTWRNFERNYMVFLKSTEKELNGRNKLFLKLCLFVFNSFEFISWESFFSALVSDLLTFICSLYFKNCIRSCCPNVWSWISQLSDQIENWLCGIC